MSEIANVYAPLDIPAICPARRERILYCAWCGNPFTTREYFEGYHTQKCDACAANPPQRPARLKPVIPTWIKDVVNARCREVKTRDAAFGYLLSRCSCKLFDRWGTDNHGNFCAESYSGNCPTCLNDAADIARLLGLKHSVTRPSFNCPWSEESVRIVFHRPEN